MKEVSRANILWMKPLLQPGQAPTLRLILLAVEEETRQPLKALLSMTRYPKVVRARQIYYWIAREVTKHSLVKIGLICAGKDHTTVLHGIRKVNAQRAYFEPELSRLLKKLTPIPPEAPQ